MINETVKMVPDELGRDWAKVLIANGEFSTFLVRDPNGIETERRVCGEFEATRLWNEWTPKQCSRLDIWDDGA